MAQSGNTVALKSFQSYMVNEGLLSKAVEAIKAGEKEARTSGNIQSFELFYKGFRQNIAIGRVYIVPPSVADKKGQDFPTALLYGCLVRTYGGEEMSDLISHKIGDSEWDEYSQADYSSIKEQLFGDGDGKFTSLVLFAPNWVNKREYVGFQFPKDDNQLANLTRHVIFSSYFDPRLSSAFDALMSDVDTSKFDVLDITPKMNFPALAENPLQEFPLLVKVGSSGKPRLALTFKTADEVTKEVLEPEEMNVFDSLDQALRNSLLPETKTVDEAGEKGFKEPAKGEAVPRLSSKEAEYQPKTGQPCSCKPGQQRDNCPQCEGTGQRIDFAAIRNKNKSSAAECEKCEGDGCKFCNNKGTKKADAHAVFETPITNVGPGTGAHDEANQRTEGYVKEKDVPKATINSAPIGIALDETGVPRRAEEERKEKSAAAKVAHGYIAFYGGKRVEIQADSLYGAKLKAIEMLKVPKSKQGLLAVELAEKDGEQVTTTITSTDKQAKRVNFTPLCDTERMPKKGDLSSVISAAFDKARKTGDKSDWPPKEFTQYCASLSQDNQAHHAVADHQKEINAGKWGTTPLSISSSLYGKITITAATKVAYVSHCPGHTNSKGEAAPWCIRQHNTDKILESFKTKGEAESGLKNMESHKGSDESTEVRDNIKKNMGQARQSDDAIKDHNASFDAEKWGGLGKKQASSLWVGSAKKVAEGMDQFTRGYIETALWSSNDESDPSGGQPLDANYDIRDLAPSCLQAMTQDCEKFQNENRELLDAAWNTDGQDAFRQGHDFWLNRNGHGAGYWDGDYPTTGDALSDAAHAAGEVDIYVGDDDLIYQMGSEDLGSAPAAPAPITSSKKTASKPKVAQHDASYISSLIAGGPQVDAYDARSSRAKSAAEKREEEMERKYGSQRRKFAEVPQDIEDIWEETMETIGPAPEIRLPGETEDNAKSTEGDHEIEAPEAGADTWSDVPEQVKGDQEEPTVKVEEALENTTTESTEDEPSTGDGGAAADSGETSEGESEESEEKSEGGSKSEWAKNRGKGKSEKKDEEPKEEAESEEEPKEKEESKTAAVVSPAKKQPAAAKPKRQRVSCNQCQMLSINGVPCHETGCPNMGARWDADQQDWVKQRECFECGSTVDEDDPCCNGESEWDNPESEEHFAGLDAILADDGAVLDQMEEAQVEAPAIFYECGSCGGVHPSMVTSEKLGLGWDGDCRDKNGHFEESDIPWGDNTQYITLEEQMEPNFDESILASAKTAGPNDGDDVILEGDQHCSYCGRPMSMDMDSEGVSHHVTDLGEIDYDADADHVAVAEQDDFFGFDEASPDPCNHQPHDRDSMQSTCEVCGQEIYYDEGKDYWTTVNGQVEASAKTADTADNPANEKGGEGAIEVKTDKEISNTHGTTPKFDVTGGKTAGRSSTPKYVIRVIAPGHHVSDASWDVNSRGQLRGAGKPNEANLAKYMEALISSMKPGGANAHLGDRNFNVTEAAIYNNDGTYQNPLATWKAPMFKVEGAGGGRSKARLAELEAIIKPELISIENGAEPQIGEDGQVVEDIATCGSCGMSWNDALMTGRTPAPSARCPYEAIHPEIMEYKSIAKQLRQPQTAVAADISGDMAEAKSEVVSPDTVDQDIKQPTVSVDEAGEKHAADISGDMSEAKSELDYNKGQVADEPKATDTVEPDHFAAEGGEFPFVQPLPADQVPEVLETLVGMGWDDSGDPGHFMKDGPRVEVLTYTDGYEVYVDGELFESGDNVDELHNTLEIVDELGVDALNAHTASGDIPVSQGAAADEKQPKSDLSNGAPEAHDVPPQADSKAACAGYGDEEDEERPIDLGLGDLADLVVEKETDAN